MSSESIDSVKPVMHFEDFIPKNGDKDIFDKVTELDLYLRDSKDSYLDGLGLQVLGPADHEMEIIEKNNLRHKVIMLGSNSYLSLTTHPKVVKASIEANEKYGYGMGSVSLYAGTTDLHRTLENLIADFYGTEEAIIFPCGYSGNVGVISALCGAGDVIINDAANHASIFDGCRLSGADIKVYLHDNMHHLEKILKHIGPSQKGRLIITDGVFSMDGDLAHLDDIVELAGKYNARVMIDDAHGIGVVGPTGRGIAEVFGCSSKIDVLSGTLSKTPGGIGGYCAGRRELIRYLRYYARTYFFSTSIPAPVIAGLIEVFKLLKEDKAGRDKLWSNINYLLTGFQKLGFNTCNTKSAIIPIIVGDENKLALFQNELRSRGIFANLVTFPAVRRKECRLRVSVMSSLTQAEMDYALTVFSELGKKYGIIK